MDHILRLNEFFVEGKNQDKSHVLLHITEPSTEEEKQKGYFFAVCEINNGAAKNIMKLQDAIDQIENGYYETAAGESKNSLETVLEKVNQESFSLIKPDVSLSCVVGVIKQTEITFSFYGRPQMILFYRNKSGIYQKMDLVETNRSEEADAAASQLFPQIIQGKISPNDYLFAGTPHINDYFNADRLQKIITTRPARQSAEHLERVLSELKNGWSFGGLIINLQATAGGAAETGKKKAEQGESTRSLHGFFHTEEKTADILSPSLLPRLNNKLKTLMRAINPERPEKKTAAPSQPQTEIHSAHFRPHHQEPDKRRQKNIDYRRLAESTLAVARFLIAKTAQGVAWLALLLWQVIVAVLRGGGMVFLAISNYQNRRRLILDNWSRQWLAYKQHFKQLPLTTKILFISSLSVMLIFAGSIAYLRYEQKQAAAEQLFNESVKLIRAKKDAAESAAIYNDDLTAVNELRAGRELLNSACQGKREKTTDCVELKKQMENISVKVRKEITVQPQLLADFSSLLPNAALKGIIKINGRILAYGPATNNLAVYDTISRASKIISAAAVDAKGFDRAAAPKENDYALFLYDKGKIARFDPKDDSIKTIDVAYPNQTADINGILIYNRRLYSLDTLNNQIYRHDAIKGGFARGAEWLKEKTYDLKNGVDLTIDGDVFVQKSDGAIAKFTAGLSQPFQAQGIEPPLDSADKIWSYTDLQYLYVLDAANKRLLILQKDGRLKAQLISPRFSQPTGLVVDEPNNTAFILDSGKLYQINLK